ncbi:MAG: alpha/beta hydrolase [Desulfobacteraceae bacterium]|nr:MAG: alpha/beta hydrolase [Desulfobacteraceae bacterium]
MLGGPEFYMETFVIILCSAIVIYFLLSLVLTYIVHQFPRSPVDDVPDWGRVVDTKIPAQDGGFLEVWRVEPEGKPKGVVLFAHGWGRNRGRMVARARIFGEWGFTTVIHSARDHGKSSKQKFMNAVRFAEDIESVMNWIGERVILYGHSAGSAGAIIAAQRNHGKVSLLFLEASYAYTKEALTSLYRWFNTFFGIFFAPTILCFMDILYRNNIDRISPALIAQEIKIPVMLIHGEKDARFPLRFAEKLVKSFEPGLAELYVAKGADHSDSSRTPGYRDAVRNFLDRNQDWKV